VRGVADTARAIYDAYVAKDRGAAERLLADNFRFTSPLDNGLDRDSYFAICWPNSADSEGFNTEVLTVRDGKIAEVEVYFGWSVPHEVPNGEHRAPK
jgi:hypothetical protein